MEFRITNRALLSTSFILSKKGNIKSGKPDDTKSSNQITSHFDSIESSAIIILYINQFLQISV